MLTHREPSFLDARDFIREVVLPTPCRTQLLGERFAHGLVGGQRRVTAAVGIIVGDVQFPGVDDRRR